MNGLTICAQDCTGANTGGELILRPGTGILSSVEVKIGELYTHDDHTLALVTLVVKNIVHYKILKSKAWLCTESWANKKDFLRDWKKTCWAKEKSWK